jgi:hypothetical protein
MILNRSIAASASNRQHKRPGYCRVNVVDLNSTPTRDLTRYGITARQARNACVIGCVAGLVAIPVLCWAVSYFNL